MNRLFLTILVLFGIFCTVPSLAQDDDIKVEMSLSRSQINMNETTYLRVTVSGPMRNIPEPQMPNLSMFDVYSQGTSTNFSIVNGKMSSSVTYTYLITPRKEGTFVVKPAVVVHNRDRYVSNEVTLTVSSSGTSSGTTPGTQTPQQGGSDGYDAGESRDVFLTAEVDKKNPYVNEQVTLKIKFHHAVRLYSQPDYTTPQTTGFWANVIEPQETYIEVINGRRYKVIEINTALFPTRAGDLTIGPAMVEVMVPERGQRRTDPFSVFDDFFQRGQPTTIRSKTIKINARPLPAEGKPDNFTGTVGDYKLTSSIDKRTTDVNQPVTVTYKINGTGNIKTIAEPVIEESKDFRVYRASSNENITQIGGTVGGTKTFEEVYIPKRAGKLTIPSVEFNFFNPKNKKYEVLNSKAFEINVNLPAEGEYADVPLQSIPGRVVDTKAKDIRFIKYDTGNLKKEKPLIIQRPIYLVINALPVLVLAFVFINRKRRDKYSRDIGYARSRTARKMARKRLSTARKLAGSGDNNRFFAEIRAAIFSYIADKKNISPHGLTGDDIMAIVREAGAGEELLDKIKRLLRKADFAQYSSASVSTEEMQESLKMAEQTLVDLEDVKID